MKKLLVKATFCVYLFALFAFSSCSSGSSSSENKEESQEQDSGNSSEQDQESESNPDLDNTVTTAISGTNVMLQGFTWTSNYHDRYYGESAADNWIKDTSNSNAVLGSKDWYDVVKENADYIKGTFQYVWFPPAKAIADVVINHRVGTTTWGTFTNPPFCDDYYAICSDDEGFSNSSSDMYNSTKKGAADTGEGYSSARDIDHTNWDVQNAIITWMTNKLKNAGFVGWRYDYVKGFGGKYVGYYNKQTDAVFSVGEHWPTDDFSSSNPKAWHDQFEAWVTATGTSIKTESDDYTSMDSEKIAGRDENGTPSKVFDFVTKGMLNTVFGNNKSGKPNSNYNLLANEYLGLRKMPESVVTFVDNHDTGSTQALWYIDPEDVGTAYAFILTHPGYPCVAWQHYFTAEESYDTTITGNKTQYIGGNTVPGTDYTYRQFIYNLIKLRAEKGISETSEVTVWTETNSSMYLAEVKGTNGSLVVNIGSSYNMNENTNASDYTLFASGTNFKIWSK